MFLPFFKLLHLRESGIKHSARSYQLFDNLFPFLTMMAALTSMTSLIAGRDFIVPFVECGTLRGDTVLRSENVPECDVVPLEERQIRNGHLVSDKPLFLA